MSWGPTTSMNPARTEPGRYNAVGGRWKAESPWPYGDTEPFTRAFERNWDVSEFYWPVTKVPGPNGWARGQLLRQYSPAMKLTWYGPMWDPTNPATWRPEV